MFRKLLGKPKKVNETPVPKCEIPPPCKIQPPNISDAVYKEGELIDCFSDFLDKQAEVIQSNKVTVPPLAALDDDDKILFEEILKRYEDYRSDTRSFTIKVRNKLEYILHLYNHKAESAKIQS